MRVLLKFFLPFILFFPAFASAANIEGPSYSSDGSFSISWQPLDNSLRCHDLKISVKSNLGYDEYFDVGIDQVTHDFYKLPSGVYTLVLEGTCDVHDSSGDWKKVAFGALALTVDHGTRKISKLRSSSAELQAKSVAPEAQQTTSVSASTTDLGWRCSTQCPAGAHSIWTQCSDRVRLLSGVYEVCPSCGLSGSANSAFCETNTNDFWTCDACPSDYNNVQISTGLSQCRSGQMNRCVINTAPPTAVTLSGTTARVDATISVSWSAVRHATSYEWKFSTQSNWTRITTRQITVSSLNSGQYVVQVRACNTYGCSALSSRTITLSAPTAPTILSNSPAPSGNFSLTWSQPVGASRYMWRRDSGNWQSVTTNQASMALPSGSYSFSVVACNAVECGVSGSKTITLTPPSSPAITSPLNNAVEIYPMTWTTIVNATYYEWRINNGSWVQANTNSAPVSNLPLGSSTLYVRACNSFECGQLGSKIINSIYNSANPSTFEVIARYGYEYPSCNWRWVGGSGNTNVSILRCGEKDIAERANTNGQCTFRILPNMQNLYTLENSYSCRDFRIKGPIQW